MNLVSGAAAVAVVAFACVGCANPSADIVRTLSPSDARALPPTVHPTAVVRGDQRIPIPEDSVVEADKVTIRSRPGVYVHRLGPDDVIEIDEDDRIAAVRIPGDPPTWIRFTPGTATYPIGSQEVRGKLATEAREIPLGAGDRIAVEGTVQAGDPVPGGGRVEAQRHTFVLVAGLMLLPLAYVPTAIGGFVSSRDADRVLVVPVAGPFINLAGREPCRPAPITDEQIHFDLCTPETATRGALIASGIAQSVGAVLVAFGLPMHAKVVDERAQLRVVPTVTAQTRGLSLFGSF